MDNNIYYEAVRLMKAKEMIIRALLDIKNVKENNEDMVIEFNSRASQKSNGNVTIKLFRDNGGNNDSIIDLIKTELEKQLETLDKEFDNL